MAESRQAGLQAAKETGRSAEPAIQLGEQGARETAAASAAAASAAQRSGSAVAECAQEITTAWTRYAEEVMRHTSEASRSLMRARTFNEMLEIQARLLRDNMRAFLDQSVKIAESASRMAKRPLEALTEAGADRSS
ncbi:MAG: phasin family protein [Alphaproteobacteria bacterium]|nr:phasin family protein [Alphaproteobacteria bacterium]MBV9685887.1 phasin family protein [Alphaproteobacteria bacterium]